MFPSAIKCLHHVDLVTYKKKRMSQILGYDHR